MTRTKQAIAIIEGIPQQSRGTRKERTTRARLERMGCRMYAFAPRPLGKYESMAQEILRTN